MLLRLPTNFLELNLFLAVLHRSFSDRLETLFVFIVGQASLIEKRSIRTGYGGKWMVMQFRDLVMEISVAFSSSKAY